MVYILQDPGTRQWGFKIIENIDGAQRVLGEEYGYDGPSALFGVTQAFKEALMANRIQTKRGTAGTWVVQLFDPRGNTLMEEEGYLSSEEIQNYMSSMRNAFNEGIKDPFSQQKIKPINVNTKSGEIKKVRGIDYSEDTAPTLSMDDLDYGDDDV